MSRDADSTKKREFHPIAEIFPLAVQFCDWAIKVAFAITGGAAAETAAKPNGGIDRFGKPYECRAEAFIGHCLCPQPRRGRADFDLAIISHAERENPLFQCFNCGVLVCPFTTIA